MRGKKAVPILIMLCVLMFSVAAFASQPETYKLMIIHGQAMYNATAWNNLFEAFEKDHPHIAVELVLTECGEAQSKVLTMTISGSPLDLVFNNCVNDYPELAFQEVFLDLTSFIERDRGELDESDLVPGVLDAVKQQGHIYGVMHTLSAPFGIAYNAQMVDENGLERPPVTYGDPSWTWDRLVESARRTTKTRPDGTAETYGFYPSESFYVHSVAQGSDFFAPEDYETGIVSRAAIDTPGNQRVFNALKELYVDLKVAPPGGTMPDGTPTHAAFGQGRIGFYMVALNGYNWPSQRNAVAPWNAGQPFGISGYPSLPGAIVQRVPGWRNVIGISRNSNNPEAAWTFIKWLLTKAYDYPELLQGTMTGVRLSHWQMLAFQIQEANVNEWALSASELAAYVQSAMNVWQPMPFQTTILGASGVNTIMSGELRRVWAGEVSVEEALIQAQGQADSSVLELKKNLGIQ